MSALTVEASYVGNRAQRGFSVRDNNLPVWTPTANTGNVDARRPDQTWRGINLITTDMDETYDAAQFAATFRKGPTYARVTYVYQRYLTTAADQAQEVGINNAPADWTANPRDLDGEMASVVPRQQLRGAAVYELPGWSNGTADLLLGRWQFSGTFNWYDGDRLSVNLGRDNNFDGFTPDRPDQTGDVKYVRKTEATVTTWFDKSTFVNPPAPSESNQYPFGNVPRNSIRGPQRLFINAGLSKNFRLKGSFVLQLRADANNVLNHPNLNNPNMNFSSADFGLIRTKTGGGRVIQLQTKLLF